MTTKRMLQLGEQIHNCIATMLVRGEIRDPRVKNVTIHSVKMTPDLQIAKVYFVCTSSNLEDNTKPNSALIKETEKGLKAAAPFIRKELGKQIQIRYIPQIMFYYDDSIEYSIHMRKVLSQISVELKENEINSSLDEKES